MDFFSWSWYRCVSKTEAYELNRGSDAFSSYILVVVVFYFSGIAGIQSIDSITSIKKGT
jgi:hypothetical protein